MANRGSLRSIRGLGAAAAVIVLATAAAYECFVTGRHPFTRSYLAHAEYRDGIRLNALIAVDKPVTLRDILTGAQIELAVGDSRRLKLSSLLDCVARTIKDYDDLRKFRAKRRTSIEIAQDGRVLCRVASLAYVEIPRTDGTMELCRGCPEAFLRLRQFIRSEVQAAAHSRPQQRAAYRAVSLRGIRAHKHTAPSARGGVADQQDIGGKPSGYPICSIIAWPNSLHLSSVAPSIRRWKS